MAMHARHLNVGHQSVVLALRHHLHRAVATVGYIDRQPPLTQGEGHQMTNVPVVICNEYTIG